MSSSTASSWSPPRTGRQALPYQAPTGEALLAGLGRAAAYFADRLRRKADGTWRLPLHPQDMDDSEDLVHGDQGAGLGAKVVSRASPKKY